ncbi:sorting nexin-17-like [Rhopilema esculentum]|uniref:sorting nexin-17-like n=1 Tax=Rhopilema esculentum TaxID=499914 RepID=UPI0031CE8102
MLFSIPETTEILDDNGAKFRVFHVHVNGVLHCKVRYRQFADFNDKLKKEFSDHVPTRLFPGKKLFSLTADQLEERRQYLESYIQALSQDALIASSETFKEFFLATQKATRKASAEDVDLDIYLMNGNKFTINVLSTDETDEVLEIAMTKIGLARQLFHYFGLFLMKCDESGKTTGTAVRMLQDFESPFLSLKETKEQHKIAIRKCYWSPKYDDDVMTDRVGLNLLYAQVLDDFDKGWIVTSDKEKERLKTLREAGSKKEFLNLVKGLKFYGYIQFQSCFCDFPKENSKTIFTIGDRQLCMRVLTEENTIVEGKFLVSNIKCWRLIAAEPINGCDASMDLKFSFEYLFSKDKLKWITVFSDEGIMMSMCLQGIVDEIIREKDGKPIRMPLSRRKSLSPPNSSRSPKKATSKHTSPVQFLSELHDVAGSDNGGATASSKSITSRVHDLLSKKNSLSNDVFEDIGDDDL